MGPSRNVRIYLKASGDVVMFPTVQLCFLDRMYKSVGSHYFLLERFQYSEDILPHAATVNRASGKPERFRGRAASSERGLVVPGETGILFRNVISLIKALLGAHKIPRIFSKETPKQGNSEQIVEGGIFLSCPSGIVTGKYALTKPSFSCCRASKCTGKMVQTG